ncbi:MAG: hypothetical protein II816_00420 [Elusimicrobia bacterium]|nr:hypothetical protein [Elusimicrobiota bacterium]
MEKQQIKQLALSIIEDGEISEKSFNWIMNNFSKKDMKLFIGYFNAAFKETNVISNATSNLSLITK